MNSTEEIYKFLNKFGNLTSETWLLLAKHTNEIELKKNDYFVKEGEVSREIGILTKGVVRAFYVTEDGKEYNKTLFAAPNIIGSYVSLIRGQANRLPQQALTDCIVTKIPFRIIIHCSALFSHSSSKVVTTVLDLSSFRFCIISLQQWKKTISMVVNK